MPSLLFLSLFSSCFFPKKYPKKLYTKVRIYCREGKTDSAVYAYKELLEIDSSLAKNPVLRAKIAPFIDVLPFAPIQPIAEGNDTVIFFSPRISRDGRWILFFREFLKEKGVITLFLSSVRGDTLIPIFTAPKISSACFGKEGEIIIALNLPEKKSIIGIKGDSTYEIYSDNIKKEDLDYNPLTDQILFVGSKPGDTDREIYIYERSKKKLKKLTNNIYSDESPRFSSNGREICFCSNRDWLFHLYSLDLRKGKIKKIIEDGPWSDRFPDFGGGNKIVFSSARTGNYDLFLLNVKSNDLIRLTLHHGFDGLPDLSEDGRYIVYESHKGPFSGIYVMDLSKPPSFERIKTKLYEVLEKKRQLECEKE